MDCEDLREALLAVRHGKQWRIPRPENLSFWKSETRERLKKLGVILKEAWECDLDKHIMSERCLLESYRLWLAASLKVLLKNSITQEAKRAILLLFHAAHKILDHPGRRNVHVDKLKDEFPKQLRLDGLSNTEIEEAIGHWPEDQHFHYLRPARKLHELEHLERIRRFVDFLQAIRELESTGMKPTGKNICPLLHKDMISHVNDTRETLVGTVFLDFRQPQLGLALRTFRKLSAADPATYQVIVAEVLQCLTEVPGLDEKPYTGKTPIR